MATSSNYRSPKLHLLWKHKQSLICLISFLLLFSACDDKQVSNSVGSISTANTAATVTPNLSSVTTPTLKSNISIPPTNTPIMRQDWHTRWLKGVPCRPPCWEGVTPGSTSADEAIQILKSNSLFSKIEKRPPNGIGLGFITWSWSNFPDYKIGLVGQGSGIVYPATTSTQTVTLINPSGLAPFKISEVIQAYGEPEYIIATVYKQPGRVIGVDYFYDVKYVYLSKGFMISTTTVSKPIISTNQELENIYFFAPGIDGFRQTGLRSEQLLQSWQGYKDFSFYCRDLDDPKNTNVCRQSLALRP